MGPLERLLLLELEFFRRLRTEAPGTVDAGSLHTSYALRFGYERLIAAVGTVRTRDIELARARLGLVVDARDLVRACDSVMSILGIGPCDR